MRSAHHTKDKGDLGVLKALIDLFEQGFTLFVPLTEHCPCEFGSNVSLRVRAPKNGQSHNVNFAADYRRAP
jgi:hypothetical protein